MDRRKFLLPLFSGVAALLSLAALLAPLARVSARERPLQTVASHQVLPPVPGPASGWARSRAPLVDRGRVGWPKTARALSASAASWRVTSPLTGPFQLFEPALVITLEAQAQAVGLGDFNSDGLTDVALTTGWPENLLYVFPQTLSGTLASPLTLTTGAHPQSLAVGDINQDGRADLAVANLLSDTLSVYLQDAAGNLLGAASYPTADGPNAISMADLNDDGRDDVVVSHSNAAALGVFAGRADGALDPMLSLTSPLAGLDDLAVGDLNNDGLTDVAKMNGQFPANPTLSLYLQGPVGGLLPPVTLDVDTLVGNGVAAGDLNGDGRDDLALSAGGNRPLATITLLTQTVTGTLGISLTLPAYDVPETLAIEDVNGDGRADLLAVHGGWSAMSVLLQTPLGDLAPYQLYDLPHPGALHFGPRALSVGDINSDGLPDAVIADAANGLVILYHQPPQDLVFMPITRVPIPLTTLPLFDDFSDPESGWPRITSTYADFDYIDDEYHILNKVDFVAAFATAGHRLADLDAATTGRRVGNAQGAYGLAFGFTDSVPVTEYFAFLIWPDNQEWNLIRFSFEAGFEVLYWGVAANIQTGTGSNRLRVRRQGDQLELWLNGIPVFGTSHPTYTGSRLIGLFQSPLSLFHDARFDDYQLIEP